MTSAVLSLSKPKFCYYWRMIGIWKFYILSKCTRFVRQCLIMNLRSLEEPEEGSGDDNAIQHLPLPQV